MSARNWSFLEIMDALPNFKTPNLRNIESLRNGLLILWRRIISHFAFFQRDSRKIVITPPTSIFRSTDKSRTPLPHSIYRRPFTLQGRKLQTSTNHYKEVKRLLNQIRYVHSTVWKFQDFTATQILREINFDHIEAAKNCHFDHFAALNFKYLVIFDIL